MKKIRNQYDKYDESRGMAEGEDALSKRPSMFRSKADMDNRMTNAGQPTSGEKRIQGYLKHTMKNTQKQGGLSGPKGVLPEQDMEEGVLDTVKKVGNVAGAVGSVIAPNIKKAVGVGAALGAVGESESSNGGIPMTPKQKRFAKLAPPVDKITFADKIVGAKKEVDEMLGDVAADAMRKALGNKGQSSHQRGQQQDDEFASNHFAKARNQRRLDAEDEFARSKGRNPNADMEEGFLDDEPTNRKSSTGGRIDTTRSGVTRHHAGKSYSGADHSAEERRAQARADADDERGPRAGRRTVGAGMGTKIGAKINRGTSKLMTREGDMDPADQGEYDREGEMAKDDIKTVVRHAQALEKILGDNDNLPEWVQAKLAKIEGMMTAVDDYMQNQQHDDMGSDDMEMDEESTNKRDDRAEKAGKKVAKDIEYDEKEKEGIHGKRRDS